MVYVFLADGFEEIEAIAPIDILRRAEIDLKIVKVGSTSTKIFTETKEGKSINFTHFVSSSRDMTILADVHIEDIDLNKLDNLEMAILPGGAGGVEILYNCEIIKKILDYCVLNNIKVGAICAAPSILGRLGYLKGKKTTAYPSFRHYLTDNGAIIAEEKVVTDGIFITAAVAGVSVEFALELVKVLKGEELAKKIGEQILFY